MIKNNNEKQKTKPVHLIQTNYTEPTDKENADSKESKVL